MAMGEGDFFWPRSETARNGGFFACGGVWGGGGGWGGEGGWGGGVGGGGGGGRVN